MGTLYLVRHGQASFGADNYDQLSELGQRQSERLGAYLGAKGVQFQAAFCGSLQRQHQTLDAICRGASIAPPVTELPGLNEYDSAALIATVHPHPLGKPDTPEKYQQFFRLLRDGLTQWMNGVVTPHGMPDYAGFVAGVWQALDQARAHHGGNVLMVSSGGPIATAVGQVLGTSPETTIELNMHIRNSAVTELTFNAKRHSLLTYNTLPHLDEAQYQDWVTYA